MANPAIIAPRDTSAPFQNLAVISNFKLKISNHADATFFHFDIFNLKFDIYSFFATQYVFNEIGFFS